MSTPVPSESPVSPTFFQSARQVVRTHICIISGNAPEITEQPDADRSIPRWLLVQWRFIGRDTYEAIEVEDLKQLLSVRLGDYFIICKNATTGKTSISLDKLTDECYQVMYALPYGRIRSWWRFRVALWNIRKYDKLIDVPSQIS